MISPGLARRLKKAGFPQKDLLGSPYYAAPNWDLHFVGEWIAPDDAWHPTKHDASIPSLSDLIAAMENFEGLVKAGRGWRVHYWSLGGLHTTRPYTTAEHALAYAWLKLNGR